MFLTFLEAQIHTIVQLKALSNGKYEPRGLIRCRSAFHINHDIIKRANFQFKQGFVDFRMKNVND